MLFQMFVKEYVRDASCSSNGISISVDHNSLSGRFSKSSEVPILSAKGNSVVSNSNVKLTIVPFEKERLCLHI